MSIPASLRMQKHRDDRMKEGFKRIQKWIYDLSNPAIHDKMKQEAISLVQTQEMNEWDEFSVEQATEGWK